MSCGPQEVILSQERSITELLTAVREQHEQLNYQKNKIKSLEDKVQPLLLTLLYGKVESSRGPGNYRESRLCRECERVNLPLRGIFIIFHRMNNRFFIFIFS